MSLETRVKRLETQVRRMSKRLHKTVIGVIPPVVISRYVETVPENGIILKEVSPTNARLTKSVLVVDSYEGKDQVEFRFEVEGAGGGSAAKFMTRRALTIEKLDLQIEPGTKLILRVMEPERVGQVWIGVLIEPEVSDSQVKRYLIDELERLEEGERI